MYNLKIIDHLEATKSDIEEIVRIKSIAWPYTYQEQVEWIDTHLSERDLHVVLVRDNIQSVAYLNLIRKELTLNGKKISAFGVGNVCSVEFNKGYGSILMRKVSDYIKFENEIGLLFCRGELVSFYQKFGWVESKTLFTNELDIKSMVFNLHLPIHSIVTYEGQLF